jgi:hypothetical protein
MEWWPNFNWSLQSAAMPLDLHQTLLSKHGESDTAHVVIIPSKRLVETLGEDICNTRSLQKSAKKERIRLTAPK